MIELRPEAVSWIWTRIKESDSRLLQGMMKEMLEYLLSAESAAFGDANGCLSEWGCVKPRSRRLPWNVVTQIGTIPIVVPGPHRHAEFPRWLLRRHLEAEHTLVATMAEAYVAGVTAARVERLTKVLGLPELLRKHVPGFAHTLNELGDSFRKRPLQSSPYADVRLDALPTKCRRDGRAGNAAIVIATATNRHGKREVVGMDALDTTYDAGWAVFLENLAARGLSKAASDGS